MAGGGKTCDLGGTEKRIQFERAIWTCLVSYSVKLIRGQKAIKTITMRGPNQRITSFKRWALTMVKIGIHFKREPAKTLYKRRGNSGY